MLNNKLQADKMEKKIIVKWQYLCLVGVLISFYIIVSNVFPEIRIPYSIWDEATTEIFNGIITSLSISYITGMLVYILTVVYKNKKERIKRRWELDALVKGLNRSLELIENEIDRLDNTRAETLRASDDNAFNVFKEKLAKTLDGAHFCKDIMNEEEYERIADIRRALSVLINPPSMMDNDESERCLKALRDIRTDVDIFKKSVDQIMWRKNNKEKSRNNNSIFHRQKSK